MFLSFPLYAHPNIFNRSSCKRFLDVLNLIERKTFTFVVTLERDTKRYVLIQTCLRSLYFRSRENQKSLCVDGQYNPSWAHEELKRRGFILAIHVGESQTLSGE